MVSIIILTFVSILAVILIGVAWGVSVRRRAGQCGTANPTMPGNPRIGRSSDPD
jgi:hypothetical protein